MEFMLQAYTDVGLRKKTNQDSVLLQKAESSVGNIAFGIVCDGMGGFAKGELASATLIKAFKEWFEFRLPDLISEGFSETGLKTDWGNIVNTQNILIQRYGDRNGIRLGTTVTGVLILGGKYYVINIGDSRTYLIKTDRIVQLTKDHTYIQREMDAGRMSLAEAEVSPQRSVLLQCVGASDEIYPDYFSGPVQSNEIFMLCCDGFRHVITEDEFLQYLNPNLLVNEDAMYDYAQYLTELNKYRNEVDNISVGLIKVL